MCVCVGVGVGVGEVGSVASALKVNDFRTLSSIVQ